MREKNGTKNRRKKMKVREYLIKQDENGAFHLFHIGDEVIRCKDCKQFRKKGEGYGCCLEGYGNVDGNHYCSYGERRDESEVEE